MTGGMWAVAQRRNRVKAHADENDQQSVASFVAPLGVETMKYLVLLAWAVGPAIGQTPDIRNVVEQALDQSVELELIDVTVVEAFSLIAEQTGVEISASPATLALLPHGSETIISVAIPGITLRSGLEELFAHLGLTYQNTGRGIAVAPTDAARRVGRRLTWPELDTLFFLHEARWSQAPERLEELRARLQFRVASKDPWTELRAAIHRVGAGRGHEVLELACRPVGWTWYPSGVEIVVLDETDQLRRQLESIVNLHHRDQPLVDVLRELGRQVGVSIQLAPGVIASLPRQTRDNLTLIAERSTAIHALDALADTTGLAYRVAADGVTFYSTGTPKQRPPTEVQQVDDPYVATIRLRSDRGDYEYAILLRESDLTPECRRLLEVRRRQAAAVLEAELMGQGHRD